MDSFRGKRSLRNTKGPGQGQKEGPEKQTGPGNEKIYPYELRSTSITSSALVEAYLRDAVEPQLAIEGEGVEAIEAFSSHSSSSDEGRGSYEVLYSPGTSSDTSTDSNQGIMEAISATSSTIDAFHEAKPGNAHGSAVAPTAEVWIEGGASAGPSQQRTGRIGLSYGVGTPRNHPVEPPPASEGGGQDPSKEPQLPRDACGSSVQVGPKGGISTGTMDLGQLQCSAGTAGHSSEVRTQCPPYSVGSDPTRTKWMRPSSSRNEVSATSCFSEKEGNGLQSEAKADSASINSSNVLTRTPITYERRIYPGDCFTFVGGQLRQLVPIFPSGTTTSPLLSSTQLVVRDGVDDGNLRPLCRERRRDCDATGDGGGIDQRTGVTASTQFSDIGDNNQATVNNQQALDPPVDAWATGDFPSEDVERTEGEGQTTMGTWEPQAEPLQEPGYSDGPRGRLPVAGGSCGYQKVLPSSSCPPIPGEHQRGTRMGGWGQGRPREYQHSPTPAASRGYPQNVVGLLDRSPQHAEELQWAATPASTVEYPRRANVGTPNREGLLPQPADALPVPTNGFSSYSAYGANATLSENAPAGPSRAMADQREPKPLGQPEAVRGPLLVSSARTENGCSNPSHAAFDSRPLSGGLLYDQFPRSVAISSRPDLGGSGSTSEGMGVPGFEPYPVDSPHYSYYPTGRAEAANDPSSSGGTWNQHPTHPVYSGSTFLSSRSTSYYGDVPGEWYKPREPSGSHALAYHGATSFTHRNWNQHSYAYWDPARNGPSQRLLPWSQYYGETSRTDSSFPFTTFSPGVGAWGSNPMGEFGPRGSLVQAYGDGNGVNGPRTTYPPAYEASEAVELAREEPPLPSSSHKGRLWPTDY